MASHPPVVQRFLRYVAIDTQASEESESYPSSAKQLDLSRLLVDELHALGVVDAELDEHGYVMGTVEANVEGPIPVIGFIAHVDTAPDVSGKDVKPQLHVNYAGGPIALDAERSLTTTQSPELEQNKGNTIITTDGSTLLGADDKAGIAEIMTFVQRLRDDPSIKHGKLRIAFTVDEEVGQGTKHFDVKKFGAKFAYTVDGESPGEIENETFCAESATAVFQGVNVHPGYAKDKMFNALKGAAAFVAALPQKEAPETTEGRQGYIHPVALTGGVEETTLKMILRDFEEAPLAVFRAKLEAIATEVRESWPGLKVELSFEQSYRNMRFVLDDYPTVVENALEAVRRAGITPKLNQIRGGTDGAMLSFKGLPTPNIFAGGHLFHSRYEWIAIEAMEQAVETLVQLAQVWAEPAE
ncbi:MAG: peptidase T [Deltaproteobacteria bacterium]|nr:peptidase T [Deltaproteobacteria bacterium]